MKTKYYVSDWRGQGGDYNYLEQKYEKYEIPHTHHPFTWPALPKSSLKQ